MFVLNDLTNANHVSYNRSELDSLQIKLTNIDESLRLNSGAFFVL